MDEAHDQVRITGIAEPLQDPGTLDNIWRENPLLRSYLGTPDNPALIIYRIRPTRILFMREWALDYINIPIPNT
jgi:general stress protein 26